jgi:hypothetical protein
MSGGSFFDFAVRVASDELATRADGWLLALH